MSDKYLAPLVAGALGFASGNASNMDNGVSAVIGGVAAIAGYLVTSKPWQEAPVAVGRCVSNAASPAPTRASPPSPRAMRLSDPHFDVFPASGSVEVESDDGSGGEDEVEVVEASPTKKSKKGKKKKQPPVSKKFKRSSYEEDEPAAAAPAIASEKKGLSKSQLKKRRKRRAEAEKKKKEAEAAAAAAAAAERARKEAESNAAEGKKETKKSKKKRKKRAKKKKAEADAAAATAAAAEAKSAEELEEEQKRKEIADGWVVPTGQKKKERQEERKKARNDGAAPVATGPQSTRYVSIPEGDRGRVYGRKACNIQLIQDRLKVNISLPKSKMHDVVTITGAPEACDKAAEALTELLEKDFSELITPGMMSDTIDVPKSKMGKVLGAGGRNFNDIRKVTKVTKLNIGDDGTITITGPTAAVETAKEAIKELAQDGFSKIINPGYVKRILPINQDVVGAVIGPSGATIKQIMKKTRPAMINTPRPDDQEQVVTVVGEEENVKAAIDMIQEIVAKASIPRPELPIPEEFSKQIRYNEAALWA